MQFKKEELVKSPLNYTGGKYKLLPQILPLFPEKINMFYDVFGGGANVSVNVNAEHIYYNDIINYTCNMFKEIKGVGSNDNVDKILAVVSKYKLSKENEDGFKQLRDDYNGGSNDWEYFYSLVCHSFNYQIRFNNNHQYNSSFGKNKSYFSDTLKEKFIKFNNRINEIDIIFTSKDFRQIDFSDANTDDFVYLDPPYLISCGVYQDGKRGFSGWGEKEELELLKLCDMLNERGIRFALSNVLESKGLKNQILIEWSKKYKVYYLNADYSNSNHQRMDKTKDVEVLITNY